MSPGEAHDAHDDVAPLCIALLGAFRVQVGTRLVAEPAWGPRKARSLVKLLALAPGHRLHRDQALETLWPALKPDAARNNLHRATHAIRRALEPDLARAASSRYLLLQGSTLALSPFGAPWVDVEAFEAARDRARHRQDPTAYEEALALYGGDLLPDDPYEDWTHGRREALRALFLDLLVELGALYEARGEYAAAVGALERVVAREPAHEAAHAGLMRLHALLGQHYHALRHYQALRDALRRDLDVAPDPETQRLYADILAGRLPSLRPPMPYHAPADAMSTSPRLQPAAPEAGRGLEKSWAGGEQGLDLVPADPAARFVGRERELTETLALLRSARLLTLVGAGGCGKTRLALAAMDRASAGYRDGARTVELAAVADARLVPRALATVLGVREDPGQPLIDAIVAALRPMDLLVVLDNCEHLVDACADLARLLLESCPGLRILATSRRPLQVDGETVWRVPSMAVPDPERLPPLDDLRRYDAMALFVARARLARSTFALTPENALEVVRVCHGLDGIPLAIELAAAWVRVLPVRELAARLDDAVMLLTTNDRALPPRHRTLRATLDWSHDLLDATDRVLLRRLGVFAGGWTLRAAEDVCAGEDLEPRAVLHALRRLVDASLVLVDEQERDDGMRYRLLETVRHYAAEKRRAAGEDDILRRRHAAWSLELAERAEPELTGPRQAARLAQLDREADNLRAALGWAVRAEPALALRLTGALWPFWRIRDYYDEGRRWLGEALAAAGAEGGPRIQSARARALTGMGMLAIEQEDYEEAIAFLARAVALYEDLGDERGLAGAIKALGNAACYQGDYAHATVLWERGLALQRHAGDDVGVAELLHNLGVVAYYQDAYGRAARLLGESLVMRRELEDDGGAAYCLINLGNVARLQGDHRRAVSLYRESLALRWALGMKGGVASCLRGLAQAAALAGQAARAAWLDGVVDALRDELGAGPPPIDRDSYDRDLDAARTSLGAERFAAVHAAGRATPLEQAVAQILAFADDEDSPALSVPVPLPSEGPRRLPATLLLSDREREITALIAADQTDARIAAALGISQRTVSTHVGSILRKLNVASRVEAAALFIASLPSTTGT